MDAEEATTTHLVVFHIIPSVVINANIFYFFYQVPSLPSLPNSPLRPPPSSTLSSSALFAVA